MKVTDLQREGGLFTPDQAAAYLEVSRSELKRLPVKRIRLGHRTVRYRKAALDAYLDKLENAA